MAFGDGGYNSPQGADPVGLVGLAVMRQTPTITTDGHKLTTLSRHRVALRNPAMLSPQAMKAMGRKASHSSPHRLHPTARLTVPARA